jgi:hypothetical protein
MGGADGHKQACLLLQRAARHAELSRSARRTTNPPLPPVFLVFLNPPFSSHRCRLFLALSWQLSDPSDDAQAAAVPPTENENALPARSKPPTSLAHRARSSHNPQVLNGPASVGAEALYKGTRTTVRSVGLKEAQESSREMKAMLTEALEGVGTAGRSFQRTHSPLVVLLYRAHPLPRLALASADLTLPPLLRRPSASRFSSDLSTPLRSASSIRSVFLKLSDRLRLRTERGNTDLALFLSSSSSSLPVPPTYLLQELRHPQCNHQQHRRERPSLTRSELTLLPPTLPLLPSPTTTEDLLAVMELVTSTFAERKLTFKCVPLCPSLFPPALSFRKSRPVC